MAVRLTFFDWNILAPIWIDTDEYKIVHGDLNLLHKEKRLLLVIERIRQRDADIVTLQEVQHDQYGTLLSELSDKYETLGLVSHELSYWTSEYNREGHPPQENGQVTFLKKGLFKKMREKVIKTTEDGNNLQIVALQPINRPGGVMILVNLHLESGMVDWKHETRKNQVILIHKEVEEMKQELKDLDPIVVLVGDFNTYGDQIGMQEVRRNGYVDVAEMLDKESPTFFVVLEDKYRITLDHMALTKSNVNSGKVSVRQFEVPDLTSSEYGNENHKSVILEAMNNRFQRMGLTFLDGLKNSVEALDILSHIMPSSASFTESHALKALRVGSDHLPIFIELELA